MAEIHALTNADSDAWLRLRLEGLRGEPYSFSKAPDEQGPITLETPNGFTLGAFENGNVIGIVTFARETNAKERHKGHVLGVYVTPIHRGKGVGHALITALIEKAREDTTLEQLVLGVMETSDAAIKLYQRAGFVSYGTEPRAVRVGADYISVNCMYLRL